MHEVRQGEKLYDPSEFGGTQIDSRFLDGWIGHGELMGIQSQLERICANLYGIIWTS